MLAHSSAPAPTRGQFARPTSFSQKSQWGQSHAPPSRAPQEQRPGHRSLEEWLHLLNLDTFAPVSRKSYYDEVEMLAKCNEQELA